MVSKTIMAVIVCLTLVFLVGCQTSTEEDFSEEGTIPPDTEETQEPVVTPPSVSVDKDDDYWQYLEFSVGFMCYMFGEEEAVLMDDEAADAFAQQYGFDSMAHVDEESQKYIGVDMDEDYTNLMLKRCPEVFEFLEDLGQDFS